MHSAFVIRLPIARALKTLTTLLAALAFIGFLLALAAPALRAADGSLSFDGAGDYVEVPNFHQVGVTSEATVEFWALTNATATQSAFMLSPDQNTNRFQAHINYSNGNTYWDCGDIGAGGRVSVASPAGSVGNWTHYALVSSVSGGFMKIYVNGVQVATVATANTFNTASAYALRIGGSTGSFLNGKLDDFRVWNIARTQAEIQRDMGGPLTGSEPGLRLYFKFDEGSGTTAANSATATGTAFNGTLNGNAAWSTPARTTYTVTNNSDLGAGSLRQALTDAALASGPALVNFSANLSGQTITLASEIVINDTAPVTLDASSLPAGLTVDDGTATTYRLFTVNSGRTVAMLGFTLANGGGTGLGDAGAILNQGSLTLTRCTITGCRSINDAGAILNTSSGTLALTQCTLSGNQSANAGGAIRSSGTLTLTHCTVSGNTGGQGGGIHNSGPFTLAYSIVAGNSAIGADKDILNTGASAVLAKVGASLVPVLVHSGGTANGSGTILTGSPNLAALASNGGPTKTCALLSPSPAINAATGSTATTDQRGIIISDTPDIGAFEFVGALNVTATADSGPGSLRAAVANAALLPGADTITFDPALSGQTLTLASELVMNMSGVGNVTVDASSLPGGLTLSGGGTHRILSVSSQGGTAGTVTLVGLTLTGGNGVGASSNGFGGAIFNSATLTLTRCTLSGNATPNYDGGAIINSDGGVLTLTQCTLSGNSAGNNFGSAIYNTPVGTLALTHCTLSGNSAGQGGGAIYNQRHADADEHHRRRKHRRLWRRGD